MPQIDRRMILTALLATPIVSACGSTGEAGSEQSNGSGFTGLEDRYGVRLGLSAVNTSTGRQLHHRADERFAMCSTFKTYAVGALLSAHPLNSGFFQQQRSYTREDLVAHSPITETRVDTGMTVFELCAAAITYSDNTAANLLLTELGGPSAIGRFARSIGDNATRLDRWEPQLNDVGPGDQRDTTTPTAISTGYRALVVGDALGGPERDQIKSWLIANTTGHEQLRAGLPKHWDTGDKTGSGDYGNLNNIAVTWTDNGDPLVIAALSDQQERDAETNNQLMVDIGQLAAKRLG